MSATKRTKINEGLGGGGGEASTVYASQPGRASGVNGWMEGARPEHEGLVMEDGKGRSGFNGINGLSIMQVENPVESQQLPNSQAQSDSIGPRLLITNLTNSEG